MAKSPSKPKLDYAAAGVDIKAGEEAVERIKELARKTFNPCVLSDIGSFGGFFKPDFSGVARPVFISSTDSVGTKVKLAFMTDKHDTVGEDLVNHCVNDILVHGARGLFFLDYIGTSKLRPTVIAELIEGLSRACGNNDMALLGGETAEMPDLYQPGEYDLAGFIVGMVDQDRIVNGTTIADGDVCIGLASSGLHTNGYSLARKIAFELAGLKVGQEIPELGMTVDEALMKVHRCYASLIHPLLGRFEIGGMAHITGGGIPGNLKRIIPEGLSAEIGIGSWPVLPVFDWLRKTGDIAEVDMFDAFNMGIGYILVVREADADTLVEQLGEVGETAYRIGKVKTGTPKVRLVR